MRILLLIRYFDFGGAENHVCDLANALHEAGHTVILASRKGRRLQQLNPAITHYPINFSSKRSPLILLQLHRIVKRHQIEVIHAHQRLPLILASAFSRISKIPVVGTVHSLFKQDVRRKWVRRGLDKVIVVCPNSFTGSQNDHLLKHKSVFIPNGLHHRTQKSEHFPDALHFYYISRIDRPHSQLISLLLKEMWPDVLQKYPEAKLSIVGDGNGLPSVNEMIAQLPDDLKSSISVKGYIPCITEELQKASLVLGVGRVAMESLAAGVPVLSLKNKRLGPVITRSNFEQMKYGNFVDINAPAPNKSQFLFQIEDFVNQQSFYKQEAIALSRVIIGQYSISTTTRATEQVYREVIELH